MIILAMLQKKPTELIHYWFYYFEIQFSTNFKA